jgi:penicillin amidase
MLRKILRYGFSLLAAAMLLAGGWVSWRLFSSLPVLDGEIILDGLRDRVQVTSDAIAVPVIRAMSRDDAFRVLGYLSAQDRLSQMDLMRRKSSGRLAEVFGPAALVWDKQQRALGLERAAAEITQRLPPDQWNTLKAYTEGVNSFIRAMKAPPLEFLLLGYQPETWRMEDSLLVALGMFQTLSWQDDDERMLSILNATLPQDLVAFLTPDTDEYTAELLGDAPSYRPPQPVPVESLGAVISNAGSNRLTRAVKPGDSVPGSNNWAVNRFKTQDGRAILANDMHLKLGVPNVWYRAVLRYPETQLAGVTLPGVPLLVAGSNGRIAWGFTNVNADLLDLVKLELNPDNAEEYRTPQGWQRFTVTKEVIRVKGGADVPIEARTTVWGPVSPVPLMKQLVAVHWTALQPAAVNLGLMHMDRATNLEEAIEVMNHAGAPPQNVLLADDQGRIGWTYLGSFPRRKGFDGSISVSWSDGARAWEGYIPSVDLPRIVDPPSGFLVTANNRTQGKNYPYPIGHNFAAGYRAFRIAQRLEAMQGVTEKDLFRLQLDTASQFYEFYRDLAMSVLTEDVMTQDSSLREIRRNLEAWDGRAEPASKGLGLLVQLRLELAQTVLSPLFGACRQADERFVYAWHMMDVPLRTLLKQKIPRTLPDFHHHQSWDDLVLDALKASASRLKRTYGAESLDALDWGRINQIAISHPFSRAMPVFSPLLDMRLEAIAGCGHCVRVMDRDLGASERMVISPGRFADGILQMPGGQSGHPLSRHYRDQHTSWVQGAPLSYAPGPVEHTLRFQPTPH